MLGKEKNIRITAYSPLGNNITGKPRVIDSPQVKEIASRLGKEPAQVLIAWGAKNGFFVIPKSVTPSRIKVSLAAVIRLTSSPTLKTLNCHRKTLRRSTPSARPTLFAATRHPSMSLSELTIGPLGSELTLQVAYQRLQRVARGVFQEGLVEVF
jgi:hypothetical protein